MLDASNQVSSFASHAYQILSDQLSRYAYFLNLNGIDALAENSKASPALMMEVFSVRSEIDDASQEEELDPIQMEVQSKYDEVVS